MPARVIPASSVAAMVLAGLIALGGAVRVAADDPRRASSPPADERKAEPPKERLATLEDRRRQLIALTAELRASIRSTERERTDAQRRVRRLRAELNELEREALALRAGADG